MLKASGILTLVKNDTSTLPPHDTSLSPPESVQIQVVTFIPSHNPGALASHQCQNVGIDLAWHSNLLSQKLEVALLVGKPGGAKGCAEGPIVQPAGVWQGYGQQGAQAKPQSPGWGSYHRAEAAFLAFL